MKSQSQQNYSHQFQTSSHSFKLPYQNCSIHSYQKLNYICLNPLCHHHSLICSLCKDQTHPDHPTRPLKYYLQQLQTKYLLSDNQSNLNLLLQELQLTQFSFYQNLQHTVQTIALQFQKLQQQVTQQINLIKNQIYQEMAKRNRFNQFYENLKRGNIDHSNFLIQNYLPQASVGKLQNIQSLQNLTISICTEINQLKERLISRQSTQISSIDKKEPTLFVPLDLNVALKKPANIAFDGNVLKQNSLYGGKNLCIIDYPIQKISGKIGFKMVQMKKGSSVIIGILSKKVYDSLAETWANNKIQQGCYALGNNQYNYGWQKCEIVGYSQSSNLELSYKNSELKIIQKNKSCKAKINPDAELFIVVCLIGESQVRLTHFK